MVTNLFIFCFFFSDSMTENHILVGELFKKFLARRQKVEHIMNELFLLWKKNVNVEYEPAQASTAAGSDDQGQNVLEESKDNMSKNSQGAKGKRNKPKKSRRGKKGKK